MNETSRDPDGAEATVRVEGLGKRFPASERWAVRDLFFSCGPGRIVGLIGGNGAGKTTTLRMLATMISPTEGLAEVCGHRIDTDRERVRRSIGILFGGSSGLYERLTARENIVYFARLNGLEKHDIAAGLAKGSAMLGMEDFLDVRAGKFSTGMRQKTLIARSIIHDPALLLLDEPATGLDAIAARSVHRFIERYRELGKTVIFSSHDLHAVERISDSVIVLRNGFAVAAGSPAEISRQTGAGSLEERFLQESGAEA